LQKNAAKTGIWRPDLLSHFPFPTFSKMGNQGSGTGEQDNPPATAAGGKVVNTSGSQEGRAARREGRSLGRCLWRVIEHPLGVMQLGKKGFANRDGCRRWASRSFPGSCSGGKLRVLVHRQARRIPVAIRLDSLGIDRLSVRDRLDLIEQIWDSLPEQVEPQDIPDWHVAELATRRRRAAESPARGQPWREVLQRLEGGS
jgi:putative addiction module component (TIGR02574 family)